MVGGYLGYRGSNGEILDHMAVPSVTALIYPRSDDPDGALPLRLGLHPRERQFARVVERLGIVRHLDIPARLLERLPQSLMRDMANATSHHHLTRSVAPLAHPPKLLPPQ